LCRRRRAAGPRKIGGTARRRTKMFFKRFPKRNFLVIENCNKISTQQQRNRRRADKLSTAARQSTKVGGGGAHKLSAAARRGRRTALA